ncbi:hypothetical protein DPPLL_28070 [Desulfofustis limnaeus]|uniref:Uncharacterized protein n=1 Tax=Desulfofustis limnaeus TaxID=2740163 RepID=A0ABM7WC10_9BACT|nr:hypothetical protein DPPLL_28070 [Desulfofustis limnaeus]
MRIPFLPWKEKTILDGTSRLFQFIPSILQLPGTIQFFLLFQTCDCSLKRHIAICPPAIDKDPVFLADHPVASQNNSRAPPLESQMLCGSQKIFRRPGPM